jgi:hypothetical protein
MSQRRPGRFAFVLFLAVVVAGAWYVRRHRGERAGQPDSRQDAARAEDPSLVLDRLWLDSKPEKYTDYTQYFFVLSAAPVGIFQQSSAYRTVAELIEYKRKGDRLLMHFPQTDKKREVSYRVRRCDDLPPFDLCLDLSDNPWGGPRRYYGLADPDQEQELLGDRRHQLEHLVTAGQMARAQTSK